MSRRLRCSSGRWHDYLLADSEAVGNNSLTRLRRRYRCKAGWLRWPGKLVVELNEAIARQKEAGNDGQDEGNFLEAPVTGW